ncbi:hypothetical protein [Mycolicibacterium baixiangningiae]|uniref:hypothetical protein n=1 Tax=Mycolicibacterium baixiangningiae TaxID=2761578 RepID=UPI00186750F9|nr:hypothetical protein [Mycolicibacterium baixiangningiae]
MALIDRFEHVSSDKNALHRPVTCGWRMFNVDGGGVILQLDTYGTAERQIPNKVSQSIQLDSRAAGVLLGLIRDTFGDL